MKLKFVRALLQVTAFLIVIVALTEVTESCAQGSTERLARYQAELDAFRAEFGGTRELPDTPFFLFGMGPRPKLVYRTGALLNGLTGDVLRRWEVGEQTIVPPDYEVALKTKAGAMVRIFEDERGIWIAEDGDRQRLAASEHTVRLPDFSGKRHASVLRVLHQELLVNVMSHGPVPNYFVYSKPWYRDGAMMALCLKATGNLDLLREWIVGLNDPFDRNNAGETEADNLGQALFLISLVSDKQHPLVGKVLRELPRFEVVDPAGKHIKGRSDFAFHPIYQTKWAKYGLRSLGLPDPYVVPAMADGYSALFWMNWRDQHVAAKDSDDRNHYPYLGWACDHFHDAKRSPISNRDYPLTWERNASQARYEGMSRISPEYVRLKLAAPHTWHAAEVFLCLLEKSNL